ncbi:hypothetical protein L249_4814 [Ophiocordyceps polyrhachis-furcata BCC 54312]|uniref:Uncharacterized protein n=1 Tax=Ophiocordyceps polyrhachis-furcata BCC 54312 TaxID=1330021 RepID=A0A367L2Q3_9HYPO|nr:hypothetical protein L249_4814 [Ophiocordyceps polyrhachis-furcata BCC 54312]
MNLDRCFVTDASRPLTEPIRIQDVGNDGSLVAKDLFTLDHVEGYLSEAQGWKSRFISICQRNSWQPLQATKPMLESVAHAHQLGYPLWELASCFYSRNSDVEEAFSVPLESIVGPDFVDTAYSLRYPEYKPSTDEWVLRQSAVYHRLYLSSRKSLFILFSPRPNSRASTSISSHIQEHLRRQPNNDDFGLHQVFFSAYIPNWRAYIAFQERRFLPAAKKIFTIFIEEPLRVSYDDLSEMASLQNRFLTISTVVSAAQQLLSDLSSLLREHPLGRNVEAEQLDNHARRCVAYARVAAHLRQQAQTTAQLLTATFSLHDQIIAKEQNGNMLKLNKSAVFVTTLTLVYAPASFVASFFGMNFFAMDQVNNRIVATPMIWIYIISIFCFTAATVAFYYWLVQHDDVLFARLAPKIRHVPDWRSLARRFTKTKEMEELQLVTAV